MRDSVERLEKSRIRTFVCLWLCIDLARESTVICVLSIEWGCSERVVCYICHLDICALSMLWGYSQIVVCYVCHLDICALSKVWGCSRRVVYYVYHLVISALSIVWG